MQRQGEEVTSDYSVAREWAEDFLGRPNVATVWIPEHDFISARRTATSFSLSRAIHNPSESDSADDFSKTDSGKGSTLGARYGLGFGEKIPIDPAWSEFSLPRSVAKELTAEFTLDGQWDAYFISPAAFKANERSQKLSANRDDHDEDGIKVFLTTHAPTSSTYPGSNEVLSWITIRGDGGELLGVAALTQWESGGKLLSSVAVHSEKRGAGIGAAVVEASVERAAELGIEHLLLAVAKSNASAIRLYEKVGFTLLGNFNHFSR